LQASKYLKNLKWPEEDLTSTADEGGGFYPLRVGETFDGYSPWGKASIASSPRD